MSEPIRVLAVGTGFFSRFHYEAWHRNTKTKLVGVCNRTLDSAMSVAEQFGIEEVGTDLSELIERTSPDVVDIITPPATQMDLVRVAASKGINVIVQKPFGENIEQAREMVSYCDRAGVRLVVHENFRFMPWYRETRKWIDEGRLGQLYQAVFRLRPGDGQGPNAYLDRQPYFQTMDRFLVHETAIHLVDTFRFLFGKVASVYADLRQCNQAIVGEDAGVVIFEFDNNFQAIFDGNRLLDHAASNPRRTMGEMLIEGTTGSLRLDGEGRLWHRAFGATTESCVPFEWQDIQFGGDCVYQLIDHVVNGILTNTPIENTGSDYLTNIEIEEAIYLSNQQHRRIDFT